LVTKRAFKKGGKLRQEAWGKKLNAKKRERPSFFGGKKRIDFCPDEGEKESSEFNCLLLA